MGYMEEIFERIEIDVVNPTKSNIQDWLSGKGTAHEKKRVGYSNVAAIFQEPFGIIERAEDTLIIEDLLELEVEADNVEVGRTKTLRVVRIRLNEASRAIDLPRAPSQPEISRTSKFSPLFAPMIEEIADEKLGISVTSESEWDVLPGEQRRIISREITRRLTGR